MALRMIFSYLQANDILFPSQQLQVDSLLRIDNSTRVPKNIVLTVGPWKKDVVGSTGMRVGWSIPP